MATVRERLLSRHYFTLWLGVSAITRKNLKVTKDGKGLLLQHQATVFEGIQESKEKYRKIVQAGIAKWVSDFQKGHIEIKSVDDLKKLIELDIELQREEL
ncbi:MAG: hypothetical protein E6713_06185 [Sporomusaceae bacterium]|nr:hypothetical protein [Sporomusaceae bacterium]